MTIKKLAIVMAATAAILIPASIASAQGMGRGPVASACAPEIGRYCAQERHGAGGVRACLESNWRRLSHDCRSVLGRTGFGQRWR
jgi:hypothetical protein